MAYPGFTSVRSYFRTQLSALGFTEWKDVFNVDNIPSTKLDKSFHLSAPTGTRRDVYDMQSQDVECEIIVRTVRKGYKDPAGAVDQCVVDLDDIIHRCLDASRRFSVSGVKNIYYSGHTIEPVDSTNDNVAVLEITFTCLIVICI